MPAIVALILMEGGVAYLKKVTSNDTALMVYKGFIKLVKSYIIRVEDESQYIDKAMEIALRYGVPVYDALYIAQALVYGELLTCDQIQARIARELGLFRS